MYSLVHLTPSPRALGTFDIKAQCLDSSKPAIIHVTSYFPTGTSKVVTRLAMMLYERHAIGRVKQIKSSMIFQASIDIDAQVFNEIVKLAKYCIQKENRCTFQLEHWGILYYNGEELQMLTSCWMNVQSSIILRTIVIDSLSY